MSVEREKEEVTAAIGIVRVVAGVRNFPAYKEFFRGRIAFALLSVFFFL